MVISGSWRLVCWPAVTLCAALSMLVSSISAAQAAARAGSPQSPGDTQKIAVRDAPAPAQAAPQTFEAGAPASDGRTHYYELWIPDPGARIELYERGIGLEPSHSSTAPRSPVWLSLLMPEQAEELAKAGIPLRLARPDAFRAGLSAQEVRRRLDGFDRIGLGPACPPPDGQFCQYEGAGHCTVSIRDELDGLEAAHPPLPVLGPYVQVVRVPNATHESRPMYAVRIGDVNDDNSNNSRCQLLVVACQHAREWVTVELALRLIRRFAEDYRANVGDTRALLTERVITFVPVANPDGYQYTHTVERCWRQNRFPCFAPPLKKLRLATNRNGVDLNRNGAFAWGEPRSSDFCGAEQYRGPAPESEPETRQLLDFLADPPGYPGRYHTVGLVNWHSYGNFAGYTAGFSPVLGGCRGASNCTPPDFAVFRELSGTERTPSWLLRDEATNAPYLADTDYRILYEAGGTLDQQVEYGPLPDGHANVFALLLELTDGSEGFLAECMDPAELDELAERQYAYLKQHWLANLDGLYNGSWAFTNPRLGPTVLPYVQRIQAFHEEVSVRFNQHEGVPLVGVVAPPGFDGRFGNFNLHQLWYQQWYWSNTDDPWKLPEWLDVCSSPFGCRRIDIDDVTTDLSADDLFPVRNGWERVGDVAGSEDYYHRLTADGPGPWILERRARDLTGVHDVKLCYSYRWSQGIAPDVEVQVSDNDFLAGWDTVRGYSDRSTATEFRGDYRYRTEIIDLSNYSGVPNVKVRFVANEPVYYAGRRGFEVFDCFLIGWR